MSNVSSNNDLQPLALTVTFKTFVRVAVMVALAFLVWGAIHRAAHEILLIFTAFFLALALNAPVFWVSKHLPGKRRGSRALATSIAFLIVIIILGAFLAATVPPLVRQTNNLIHAAPHLISDLRSQNGEVGKLIRHYHLQDQVGKFSKQLSSHLQNIGGAAFSTAQKVSSSAFSLLTILVLTFMMLVEGPRWINFFKNLVPSKHNEISERMMHDMYRVVKGFVNGQVILATIASFFISIAVFALGISYPVALILVIFVCGLIPLVGHTIGAVIVTLVALSHSITAAVIIFVYYLSYQAIENYLIQPRIQANSTNMSPLLVFMSVVLGVSFGGLFGGLVAIPVAGCLRIALLEYLQSENIIGNAKYNQVTHETK